MGCYRPSGLPGVVYKCLDSYRNRKLGMENEYMGKIIGKEQVPGRKVFFSLILLNKQFGKNCTHLNKQFSEGKWPDYNYEEGRSLRYHSVLQYVFDNPWIK